MKLTIRAALRGSLCAAALVAGFSGSAGAQTTPTLVVGQVPLSDTDCNADSHLSGQPPELTTPPCTVNGTRTLTAGPVTRRPFDATMDLVSSSFDVQFDGQLNVDGFPAASGPTATFPFGGSGPRDASNFFGTEQDAIVDLQSSYTGRFSTLVPTGAPPPNFGGDLATFTEYSNFNNIVRSINVDQSGYINGPVNGVTESEYAYQLKSVDPANIINGNSVALTGEFGLVDQISGIQFGKLSGSATLVSGNNFTPYPEDSGAVGTGIFSPFAMQYDVQVDVTTQLDENGLITPKVEVKDGIEMNGSRVTGLGDGVDAGDAVNKGQLDTVAATANGAAAAATSAQATAGTAVASAAAAQDTADTALTTANLANAKADQALAEVQQVAARAGNVVGDNDGGAAPTATGNGAVAGGSGTVAEGEGAVAFGLQNQAKGNGAVAIGDPNIATGTGAVAIGANNMATGTGAVALGNASTASGASAIALGDGATAGGAGNVALGGGASANGANSVALGNGSVAAEANTVSVGAAGAERRIVNVAAGTAATDAVNKGQLDSEVAARQTMGVELGAAISAETAARQQANLQISQRLAVQEASVTALTTGLSNEMSARIAADNALSQRIDAVSTRLDQIDSQIAILDDRISSSTAVASALSGNAFLPDMKFNLTANVATYDGAQAGSIQMGVLLSPHVALNAGVASGFNRRGKTAARAGVTIGF